MGIPSVYVWMRFHHVFSLPLLALARLLGLTEVQQLSCGGTVTYHHFSRVKPVEIAYGYLLLLDTMLASSLKVYVRLTMGKTVVCDRFTYDTLVDLMISTDKHVIVNSFITKCFLSLATRAIAIILIATPQTLRDRRKDVQEDRYLDLKVELYNTLSKRCKIPVLNGQGSIPEVHSSILRILDEARFAIAEREARW